MGMFDDVKCEVPLPDGFIGNFQSKTFDCLMDTYVIRADGRLVRDDGWLRRSDGKPQQTDMNFHGIMRFYTNEGSRKDGTYRWHEYSAKFTDGALVSIDIIPDDD